VALASGCVAISTEQENIAPFADATVKVLGVENLGVYDEELLYLREYVDDSFVELDRLQELLERIDYVRDRLVIYSIDLLQISNIYDTDAEKVSAYSDIFDADLRQQMIEIVGVQEQDWDALLDDIRGQEDLLSALRAVQPITARVEDYLEDLILEVETMTLPTVRREFDRRILDNFREVLDYSRLQARLRDEAFDAFIILDDYRRGDLGAFARLRNKDYLIDPSLLRSDAPTDEELAQLEAELRQIIIDSTEMQLLFETDLEIYRNVVLELDRKEAELLVDLSLARLEVNSWLKSHQALADGIRQPSIFLEWISETSRLLSFSR